MRVCIADHDRTTIEKAMQELVSLARNGSDDVLAVEADVSSPDDIDRLAENAFGRFGDIALLMNNAAAFQGSDALSDPDGWRRILDVNVLALIRNKLGGEVVSDPVIEGLGCGVGGEAQDLAARDSSKACCAIDNEEAQGLHAGDSVAISSLARARLGSSQSRMQLEATHQVMGQDGKLQPGAIGAVVIGGDHVECKFPLELGEGLFLRPATGSEVPQHLRGEAEIGRHRGVFEVTVVG
jgi:NAD(P)-dependent dehydrogenase (short-subunit alcohol dehydrogenase family)